MILGYNTNGLAAHRWEQALELMHEVGYRSVAITVDHSCLDPYSGTHAHDVNRMRRLLERYEMISCIESGARFLLDPRDKHQPTLVSPDPSGRAVRLDFLKRCVAIARSLGSEAMSFWSGALRDAASRAVALARLADGIRGLLDTANEAGVRLAFEPEPGMLVQTVDDYRDLLSLVDDPCLGLCLDIGHAHCSESRPIAECIHEWGGRIFTIHIEDMVQGIHRHLRFGQGSIDFPPVIDALSACGYRGGLNVELSQYSHIAPEVLRESFEFLSRHVRAASGPSGGGLA